MACREWLIVCGTCRYVFKAQSVQVRFCRRCRNVRAKRKTKATEVLIRG